MTLTLDDFFEYQGSLISKKELQAVFAPSYAPATKTYEVYIYVFDVKKLILSGFKTKEEAEAARMTWIQKNLLKNDCK